MSSVEQTGASRPSGSYTGEVAEEQQYHVGDGWVLFAGVMLLMVGTLNFIDGIAAISNSTFFTENAKFVISNLNTWGWVLVILGAAQLLAAVGIWARTPGVRWFGVAVAGVNGIAQMLFIPAYPFWSLTLFTLDLLVIYGLIAHGKRRLA
jgi:hypothetical protein